MPYDRPEPAPHPPIDWVLLANAARARVFQRDEASGALREIADALHDASRQTGAALGAGRPGQVHKSAASTALAPHTEVHDREHARFARELAQMLEAAALEHRMRGWALLASNPFLGVLKSQLGAAAKRLLQASVAVDLTLCDAAELEQRVARALRERD